MIVSGYAVRESLAQSCMVYNMTLAHIRQMEGRPPLSDGIYYCNNRAKYVGLKNINPRDFLTFEQAQSVKREVEEMRKREGDDAFIYEIVAVQEKVDWGWRK